MRCLVIHNRYRERGGEDAAVEAEVALLRSRGHDVRLLERSNANLDGLPAWKRATTLARVAWSPEAGDTLTRVARRIRPDVVHVHNHFPLWTPAVYGAARALGLPVVQTIHNYRLACAAATFFRDGHPCEECLVHGPWRAVRHGCYQGSRLRTAAVAHYLTVNRRRGTWHDLVDLYVAPSEFVRAKLAAAGLPRDRIVVKPNCLTDAPPPAATDGSGVVFVGRLSPEKGADLLVAAAVRSGVSSRIVGDGPDRARLERLAAASPAVHLPGWCGRAEVWRAIGEARAVVVPSRTYEGCPMAVLEAFAAGRPVIAARLGALAELVREGETGLLFTPGDVADLARCLGWAEAHPQEMRAMGGRARAEYEWRFSAAATYRTLLGVYRRAMADRRQADAFPVLNEGA